jgi:hypothetical protein
MDALETYQRWLLEKSKDVANGKRTRKHLLSPQHEELLLALGTIPHKELLTPTSPEITLEPEIQLEERDQLKRIALRTGGRIDSDRQSVEERYRELVGHYAVTVRRTHLPIQF